jgi:hypothetical protein
MASESIVEYFVLEEPFMNEEPSLAIKASVPAERILRKMQRLDRSARHVKRSLAMANLKEEPGCDEMDFDAALEAAENRVKLAEAKATVAEERAKLADERATAAEAKAHADATSANLTVYLN